MIEKYCSVLMEGIRDDEGGSWAKWTQDQNFKGSIRPCLKRKGGEGANSNF